MRISFLDESLCNLISLCPHRDAFDCGVQWRHVSRTCEPDLASLGKIALLACRNGVVMK